MRFASVALVCGLLVCCNQLSYAYSVCSFEPPTASISGLACSQGLIWILDSNLGVIFSLDKYNSYSITSVIDTQLSDPGSLAWAENTLYYTQDGSTIIYSVTADGLSRNSFDLASLGIQSITGIGYDLWSSFGPSEAGLFILDSDLRKVFLVFPLGEFSQLQEIADLSSLPQYYDVSGSNGWDPNTWIACGSEEENAQLWDSSGLYEGFQFTGSMITEIAQDDALNPAEHIWTYDATSNVVSLWYWGTALERFSWGSIKTSF